MWNGCRKGQCGYWEQDGENGYCADEMVFVNEKNGIACCRYHPDAVLKSEYDEQQ